MVNARRVAAALVASALMAGAIRFGLWPTLAVALITVGLVAVSWPWLLGLRHPTGGGTVIVVAGVIGAGLMAWQVLPSDATAIVVALASLVFASFLWQLARRDGRPDLVRSVVGIGAGGMVALTVLAWLPMARNDALHPWAWLALGGLAASLLARLVPAGHWLAGALGVLLAAGAGYGLATWWELSLPLGLALGALVGLLVAVLLPVGHPFDEIGPWRDAALAAALPLAATGTLSLFYCLLLVP